jgi:hypothetical protein
MSKAAYYRQCRLRRGNEETTSYIPEEFAVVGKVLRLRDDSGKWESGWVVDFVTWRLTEAQVNSRSREHLKTRKNTDI